MAFAPLAHDIDEMTLDRNTSVSEIGEVLREKIERAFAESGVLRFKPREGDPYDEDRHKVANSLITSQPEQDRAIAHIHRLGYETAGQVLSPALVTIFKFEQ